MKPLTTALTWICQLAGAAILAMAGLGKLQAQPMDVETFSALGMEPTGRILIGILELIAAVGLLHPASAAYAALLGAGVLTGAGLAHLGPLGFQGIELFAPTYAALLIVLVARWKQLPLSASRTRH